MKGITVYCASAQDIAPVYFENARLLGQLIAQAGLPVISGGGRIGLMGAVTDGALAAGGKAIGVIPQFMVDKGLNHPLLTETIITETMAQRKQKLAELACGVVALPGGVGTLEELTETMTNRKLGFFNYPIVILNTAGYYDHLIAMLMKSEDEHFSYGERTWMVANTPQEAISLILG